ncbi:MAG: hypothetical protein J0H67_18165 [Rhodospirillales bacterium]|nr:hypothetical protein [Rhodospirillales bacterium]
MPLYRIIRSSGRSAVPSSTWICKPTDAEALIAARDLLGRGDYAEVWGEHELVGCLRRGADAAAAPRARGGRPMMRYAAAGLATTTGIALLFMTLQGAGRAPAGPAAEGDRQVAVVTPAVAGDSDASSTEPMPMDVAAAALGEPEPSAGTQIAAADDSAETATLDPQSVQAAAPPPPGQDVPIAVRPVQRAHRHVPVRQLASRASTQRRVFASREHSVVNVYAMFGQGYVQGGN